MVEKLTTNFSTRKSDPELPNDLTPRAEVINVTTGEKSREIQGRRGVISRVGCGHRCTDEGEPSLSVWSNKIVE